MGVVARILLTAATFVVITLVMCLAVLRFGIETGTWKSALLAAVVAAVIGGVWRTTAPKQQPPPPH
jgi:hypothetical protein